MALGLKDKGGKLSNPAYFRLKFCSYARHIYCDYCPIIMEFPLTEVSSGLMHKLKECDCPLFQMPREIERVKIGCSSGNHGTLTKPASASSSRNYIYGSKKETEILVEARRCYALKTRANPIEKGWTHVRFPLKSWNIPPKVAWFFLIRVNISSAPHILTSDFIQTLGAFNETAIRGMWPTWENWLSQEQNKWFRHWNPKTILDSRSKRLKSLPARRSQRHPGAPTPQGRAAIVCLFGTDCSDYDPSGQSKSPEQFPLF
jgi:hypothetical protein